MEQDKECKSGQESGPCSEQDGEQPLPVEPLPESKRSKQLRMALLTTVETYITSLKSSWFCRAFPDLYEHNRLALRLSYQAWCKQLKEHLNLEIHEILDEPDFMPKINRLQQIVEKNQFRKGTVAWRPSGIPPQDLEDHFQVVQSKHLESLEIYLHNLKADNSILENKVQIGRAEVKRAAAQAQIKVHQLTDIKIDDPSKQS